MPLLGRGTSSPVVYNSLAVSLYSNDYRTTGNNIRYQTPGTIRQQIPLNFCWSAEHNDFDEILYHIGDPRDGNKLCLVDVQ